MFPDNDPRSWNYKREYVRPPLHLIKVIIALLLFTITNISVYLLFQRLEICFIASALILAFGLRRIIIFFVKCYQHFAPISVRSMCRFEPSCSEYMILAVEKYGVIRGVRLGLNRIVRCGKKDGGFDYP